MDFAWVVDALRRGLKVTRKVWAGDPLYIELTAPGSNSIIAVGDDTQVENWLCSNSDIFADDWEEYVEPEKAIQLRSVTGETIKVTHEEIPVWPEVNADGYARMSKDSDVIVHDGVYRCRKEQKLAASMTQQLLVCKHKSYEVGWFMAQLNNMYEAACQHMPSMRAEWDHVKNEIENTIREHWKYYKR